MDLKKILRNDNLFTLKEKKVVDYIINHTEEFAGLTVREVATLTGVSISTIVRLCKKLGTKGFSDFKFEFYKQKQQNSYNFEGTTTIMNRDTPYQIIKKMSEIQLRIGNEAKNEMDVSQIETIVDYLLNAEKITLYGSGVNRHLNEIFSYLLIRLGKNSYVPSNWEDRLLRVNLSDQRDIAIVLSHRGNSDSYYYIMQGLYQKHIPIILLTGKKESKMASLANEVLYVNPGNRFEDMSNIVFSTSVSYVYDILFACMYSRVNGE